MRSLGTVIVVAVVLYGCSEILAVLGVTDLDIPADSYSVVEGRTWDVPLDISGCDGPPESCVTWHSDNECVVSFGSGATTTAVHFGTARVDVQTTGASQSDHADVTVLEQTPVRIQLAERFAPLVAGLMGVLPVKLFDAADHELHRSATFTTGDTTLIVVQGVDPGCRGMWPDGVQIRGVRAGTTFVFARFDNLVDSSAVTVRQ